MNVGIHPVSFPAHDPAEIPGQLARVAAATERAGCSHLLLMDHFLQLPFVGDERDPMLEGYTACGYLAALTSRVDLGLLVTGVTYRHPAILVKMVTTLDVLSGGRAVLGIGAAWNEREHLAYGIPFPPVTDRFAHLEDALEIAHRMWSDDDGPYEGNVHRLGATLCSPRPLRSPHPPIIVGGGGEKRTLRLVARYADATNFRATGHDEVAHKLAVLDGHCTDLGRDPVTVARTLLVTTDPFAEPGHTLEELHGYAELGIETVFLVPPPSQDPVRFVDRVGEELVPELAGC